MADISSNPLIPQFEELYYKPSYNNLVESIEIDTASILGTLLSEFCIICIAYRLNGLWVIDHSLICSSFSKQRHFPVKKKHNNNYTAGCGYLLCF